MGYLVDTVDWRGERHGPGRLRWGVWVTNDPDQEVGRSQLDLSDNWAVDIRALTSSAHQFILISVAKECTPPPEAIIRKFDSRL